MIVNELHVRLGDITVGTLAHLSGDRITLIFDSDYIQMPDRPTLGLSFLDDLGGIIPPLPTKAIQRWGCGWVKRNVGTP